MITIVSKNYCPYCSSAKQLITSLWFEYKEVDVTNDPETLRQAVEASGMMTVPQVYAGDISSENSLGWFDDISALHQAGELVPRLESL